MRPDVGHAYDHAVLRERHAVERFQVPGSQQGAADFTHLLRGDEARPALGCDAAGEPLANGDAEPGSGVVFHAHGRPHHQLVALAEQDDARFQGGRGVDQHAQQPVQQVVQVAALEGGCRDAVEGVQRAVAGSDVTVDGGGDGPIHRAVQEPHLRPRGTRGPLVVPDAQDAVAEDGQLDDHLGQVEAFRKPFQRMALGRIRGQAGARVVHVRLAGLGDVVHEVGDVVEQALDRQALGGRAVAHRIVPGAQDLGPVRAEERRQLRRRAFPLVFWRGRTPSPCRLQMPGRAAKVMLGSIT